MKTVVITGAAGCLGSAFARHFVAAGDQVMAIDRRSPKAHFGADVWWNQDIRNSGEISHLFRGDMLINCAGVVDGDGIIDINLAAPINLCGLAISRGYSTIINIASKAGLDVTPHRPVYAASKAGLIQYTLCMAKACPQIKWCVVCPGPIKGSTLIDTTGYNQNLMVTPEEVVAATLRGLEHGTVLVRI